MISHVMCHVLTVTEGYGTGQLNSGTVRVVTDRWLSDEELDSWRAVAELLVLLPAKLDDAVQPYGLSFFDYSALAVLSRAPGGSLPTTQLAGLANGSLTRLSHLARRLERRGIVERVTNPEDRRVTLVTLTDTGRALLDAAAPAHVDAVRALVVDVLEPDELVALAKFSRLIAEPLNPATAPPDRPA